MGVIPVQEDLTIVRGTTEPYGVGFFTVVDDVRTPLPLTDVRLTFFKGNKFYMRVTLSEGVLVPDADGDEISGGSNGFVALTGDNAGRYLWTPTPTQTRLVPQGDAKSKYELEVWNGSAQTVYKYGDVTGLGGGNDDD